MNVHETMTAKVEALKTRFGLESPDDIDKLSYEELTEAVQLLGGPEAMAQDMEQALTARIVDAVIGAWPNLGPERIVKVLEQMAYDVSKHIPCEAAGRCLHVEELTA